MKVICTHDFPNPPGRPFSIADVVLDSGQKIAQSHIKGADGKEIKDYIHKGAIFTLGSADKFADLSPTEKTLFAQLRVSGKILEADDLTVKKVLASVQADKERDAADAKRNAAVSPTAALEKLIDALPKSLAEALTTALAPKKAAA